MTETLFIGGAIFDGENEPESGRGVLVADGTVKRIAPAGEFDGFAGPKVDTKGATLLPGLIDCHVHVCLGAEADPGTAADKLSEAQLTLKALARAQASLRGGVTAIRDCGGKQFIDIAVRDAMRQGMFDGPSMRASGQVICMTGGHGNRMGRVADGKEEVVKAVREQIQAGADQIKVMATGGVMTPGVNPEDAHYSAEEMAACIAEAGRFHRRTASHAQGAEGILNAVRGGITSIEHGIFMTDRCIEEMLERGVYLVPTLSAVRHIIENKDQGIPAWAVEKSERVYERHVDSFRRFHDAGGLIAMGTDAGTPFNRHGDNARELGYMVDCGMTPLEALRSSTSRAADLVDLPGEGRIREGGAADFLVVDGDPFSDITRAARTEHHRAVVKGGKIAAGLPTYVESGRPLAAAASTL